MKNLFRLSMLAIFMLAFTFVSCDKEDSAVDLEPTVDFGEISFNVSNVTNSKPASKGVFDDNVYPVCVDDADAAYIHVVIDGTTYNINMTSLDSAESEVLKLAAGTHTITEFAVFDLGADGIIDSGATTDDDVVLYTMPNTGSIAEDIYNLTGLPFDFEVEAFQKVKRKVDVVCYNPASYSLFGYAWFQYTKYEENELFFFGNICSKFWAEWHAGNSIYANQPVPTDSEAGYDFAAILTVKIFKGNDKVAEESNIGWYGVGAPLAIKYLDNPAIDEPFTYEIWLELPDGTKSLIHSADLLDGTSSNSEFLANGTPNPDYSTVPALNFGESDGVFDLGIGNCDGAENNDIDLDLPAWMPIPSSGTMTLSPGDRTYVNIEISGATGNGLSAAIAEGIWNTNGTPLAGWCGDKDSGISFSSYPVNFLSSLDYNSLPQHYKDDIANLETKLNVLNWIVNNVDLSDLSTASDADNKQLGQAILWMIIHGGEGTLDSTQKHSNAVSTLSNLGINASDLSTAADAIKNFKPTVGDWAVVFLDVINDASQPKQMMFIQVDP